jgi:pimeloyl-ACP methyl ester carboxylesterase
VALNCALRYPHRLLALILLRPAWLDSPTPPNVSIFDRVAHLLQRHGPKAGLELFRSTDECKSISKISPDSADSLAALFTDPRAAETCARLERIPRDAPNRDRAEWRRVALPTLVLANRQDPIHPFEYGEILAREIPGAMFEELTPKSVNLAQYTAELNRSLEGFLRSLKPYA